MYADGGLDAMEDMFYSIEFWVERRRSAGMSNHTALGVITLAVRPTVVVFGSS
ncbi:MAG: hypothetical protein WA364_08220 [Candidatus Nitrosopolaris sp.]